MEFLVCYHGESFDLTINSMEELQELADKYGWVVLNINFKLMVIEIH